MSGPGCDRRYCIKQILRDGQTWNSIKLQNSKRATFVYVYRMKYTRCFKYDRDYLCVNKSQFVPVIFEPPCRKNGKTYLQKIQNLKPGFRVRVSWSLKKLFRSGHLEFPCRHCKMQTSGTLLSSKTSDWAVYRHFLLTCCNTWICRLGFIYDPCVIVPHHIFVGTNSTTWYFPWFKSIRFLSLRVSEVYCLRRAKQWRAWIRIKNAGLIGDDSYNWNFQWVRCARCCGKTQGGYFVNFLLSPGSRHSETVLRKAYVQGRFLFLCFGLDSPSVLVAVSSFFTMTFLSYQKSL
jgi:hypothetical protein